MFGKLLGGTAAVVALTASLAACDRTKDVAQNPTPSTQMADASSAAPASTLTGSPRVPVMMPTGDDAQAVKPAEPSKKSRGTAPTMQPTGESMPAYTPPATTR